jgi:hypothetical protein
VRRLALPVLATAILLVAVATADAKRVGMSVRGVAFCASKPVNVRLTNGQIVQRKHVIAGRSVESVVKASKDLLLYLKIKASWPTVQRGQTLRITADGPQQEQWVWRIHIHNARPLADPTNYQACIRLKTRSGNFLKRMQAAKGSWTFTARITKGSLAKSSGHVTIRSR